MERLLLLESEKKAERLKTSHEVAQGFEENTSAVTLNSGRAKEAVNACELRESDGRVGGSRAHTARRYEEALNFAENELRPFKAAWAVYDHERAHLMGKKSKKKLQTAFEI